MYLIEREPTTFSDIIVISERCLVVDKKRLLIVSTEIYGIEYYYRMLCINKCNRVISEDFLSLLKSILTKSGWVIISSADELPLSGTLSLMEEYLIMWRIENNRSSGDGELRLMTWEVEGWDTEECSHMYNGYRVYPHSIFSYAFFKYFTMYSSLSVYPRFS